MSQKFFKFPPMPRNENYTKDESISTIEDLSQDGKVTPLTIEKNYKSILVTFCITNFIFNMGISVVVPFYPSLANEEAGLNFGIIGFVISCSPLGSIFGGLLIAPRLHKTGRKSMLIASLVVQAISVFMFGILQYITTNKAAFLSISIISRLVQGFSRSIYGTLIFSYIPLFWPLTIQSKIGLLESMTALGLMFGPIVGAGLNALFGYSMPFYGISLFFIMTIIPSIKNIPEDSTLGDIATKKSLTLGIAFKSSQVISTFFLMMAVIACLTYVGPIFVHHMASFGIDQNLAALIYSLPTAAYCGSLLFVPKLQYKYAKTKIMSFGLMMCAVASLILAPFWTGQPSTIAEVIIGQFIIGAAQACSVIPSIPRLMEILAPLYPEKQVVSDVASGIFVTALSIGNFISPVISGKLYDVFGGNTGNEENEKKAFQENLLVLAGFMGITLLQFMIFGGGWEAWRKAEQTLGSPRKQQSQELLLEKQLITKE